MIHETLDAIDLSPVLSLCSWTNHRTIATSHISLPSMLLKNGIYQCYIPRLKKGIFILWRLSIQIHSHSIKENWAPLQKALCLNYQKRFWYTSCDFITMQPYSTLIYLLKFWKEGLYIDTRALTVFSVQCIAFPNKHLNNV